jgi:monoamine oxidase
MGWEAEWCGEFIDAEHATMHQLIKRLGLRTVELGGGRRDRTRSVLYFGHRYTVQKNWPRTLRP